MNNYNEELKNIIKICETEALLLQHPYVGTEHLILAILKDKNNIKELLKVQKITYTKFKNKLLKMMNNTKNKNFKIIYTPVLKKVIKNAHIYNCDNESISINEVLLSLIDENEGIAIELLKNLNCDLESLYTNIIKNQNKKEKTILEEIGINMCEENSNNKLCGREKEIKKIVNILARKNKNNPILIGEAGVGKTAIIEEIGKRIKSGKIPKFLKEKKIISLSTSNIVSGTKYRGEFEEKLNKIIREVEKNENIILFIDEIHTLIGAGGAEGAIDASNILKPALARGKFKCIGATTIQEYKKYIEKDKAFERRFQKILIEEPTKEETKIILKSIKVDYEIFHNVTISEDIIENIVEFSNLYIKDRKEPDRSIDILDELCAKTNIFLKKKKVSLEDLKSIIEEKNNFKIFDSFSIKKNMKNYIFGQNEALEKIDNILNNTNNNSPLFIVFEGKKGIGKSYTAHALAKELKRNIIDINMDEYNNETSINKILGSVQGYIGYDDKNTTFEEIKEYPASVIIIEKIENAHPNILSLIEDIYENGIIKNSKKENINFNNCIFIIIANKSRSSSIGFYNNSKNNRISIELIKKINNNISFKDLNKYTITKIIKKKLKENNINIDEKELKEIISDNNLQDILSIVNKYKNKVYEKL